MENASKALIIAGAILLSILLISLGIMIFNQAQDTTKNSGMGEAEKTTFNAKFTKYEGTQKGSMVKSLIQEILAVNSNSENTDAGIQVNVSISGAAATPTPTTSSIVNNKTYTVSLTYSNGRVSQIDIQ